MVAKNVMLVLMTAAIITAVSGCGSRVDPAMFAQFQRAQESFEQARQPDDFLRVAAQYQELLDTGLRSGAVYYNQGNAFMRAGKRGRAIACYRQAARYRPRDPYLQANLVYALGEVATEPPRKPLIEYIFFWQNWLSYPEKVLFDTLVGVMTFLLAAGSLFWRPKLLNRLAIGGLLLTFILGASVVVDWFRFDVVRHGVVIHDGAIARKGDALSYAPAFTKPLPEGAEFRLLERRGQWILIELPGAQQGWVDADETVTY